MRYTVKQKEAMVTDNGSMSGATYSDAGVNIDAGTELVNRIKEVVKDTRIPGVLGSIGGFGGFFQLDLKEYCQPVLVSSVDGVGTKLMVAAQMNVHDTVGQDLVNHCVDDILVCGARPLYFLDYFATGRLNVDAAEDVIRGFAKACKENGCALIGGETAEMPGMYKGEDYDLAGTIVGIVERDDIIDGSTVQAGYRLLGLPSTGLHTNGYSLARQVLIENGPGLGHELSDGRTVGEALLAVHRSYLKPVAALQDAGVKIAGLSHITGGGIHGNTSRILPEGLKLDLGEDSWPVPEIFKLIQSLGNIADAEMLRAFNLGIGLIIILSPVECEKACQLLGQQGELYHEIGEVVQS